MRPKDVARGQVLTDALRRYQREVRGLVGLRPDGAEQAFIEQVVESIRRIEYVRLINSQSHPAERADPSSAIFDPLIAASMAQHRGDIDEGCWLVFLSTHFGKHRTSEWQLTRDVYGRLGDGRWDWSTVAANADAFQAWLTKNQGALKPGGVVHFGNHRKYQTLRATASGTGAAVKSYVNWVLESGDHRALFAHARQNTDGTGGAIFDWLYRTMTVASFGRMARFDYLTMLGKLDLAPIEPASPYIALSTGPLAGARLLFFGNSKAEVSGKTLDGWVVELGSRLGVGMQVMEDAICNWQKSPRRFVAFRG